MALPLSAPLLLAPLLVASAAAEAAADPEVEVGGTALEPLSLLLLPLVLLLAAAAAAAAARERICLLASRRDSVSPIRPPAPARAGVILTVVLDKLSSPYIARRKAARRSLKLLLVLDLSVAELRVVFLIKLPLVAIRRRSPLKRERNLAA